ncbi:MAG: hypothetical protein HY657_16530 [Acidobacteria bacterium]|nr:hypothetical protein [Acidobacteriota bacterium]
MAADVLVALRDVRMDYRGLRPLRVGRLELREGESIALLGFDRVAAQMLVDLITGAAVPDTGEVDIFGKATHSIPDSETWLRELDRFGIVSERMVLLDQLSAEQNLAMPFSLDVGDLSPQHRAQVRELADEVGLAPEALASPLGLLEPFLQMRVRLGKALALDPRVLLAEHPNALVPADDVRAVAADFVQVVSRRRLAALVLTADRGFARAVAKRVLTLDPGTGELSEPSGWLRWFG